MSRVCNKVRVDSESAASRSKLPAIPIRRNKELKTEQSDRQNNRSMMSTSFLVVSVVPRRVASPTGLLSIISPRLVTYSSGSSTVGVGWKIPTIAAMRVWMADLN